jgi:hypothetical protein
MLCVPIHSGDVPRGLFSRILKDAGFSEEDFFGKYISITRSYHKTGMALPFKEAHTRRE